MGGFGGPRPKRDLTSVVRKIELLTGDVGITLTGDQASAIIDALEKTRYNKTRAAELLGMSFRQLRYRIKKLKIDA